MNKAILIGRLTRDPEMRTTQSGISVCQFSIAVDRKFKNQQTGEREADFINIVAWRQLADLCAQYLAKGRKVSVVGSIQTRSYEANDGSKRTAFEVVADEVEFLTPKEQGAQQHAQQSAQQSAPAAPRQSYKQAAMQYPPAGGYTPPPGFTMVENELPF